MPFSKPEIEELLTKQKEHYCEGDVSDVCVKVVAVADFPSRFGKFQIFAFYNNRDQKEHVAIMKGDVCGKDAVPVRLHSECLTGDALGSLRCDCRDQLTTALSMLGKAEFGLLIYLRQEGRGIGLLNKLKAYQLQDHGFDTVDANVALGFKDDERDYAMAAHILKTLEVGSVMLITNNPRKMEGLERHGTRIVGRIPLEVEPSEHNREYLLTKLEKSGHLLENLFD